MTEISEIQQAIDHLNGLFADLIVRGLRSAGPAQLAPLDALREEFERIGADHLAGRISDLGNAVRQETPGAAGALLRAQTSLNLFERILTREHAVDLLEGWQAEEEAP
jgi:hypothetical protein